MKYLGSKARIANHILPFMSTANGYYEPFAGGMNMMSRYKHDTNFKVAIDSNCYLIEMFKKLLSGWEPREYYDRDDYAKAKSGSDFELHEIGWIGFNCSYSGKWFGGFAGKTSTKDGLRNYQDEAYRNVKKQLDGLRDVKFICSDYKSVRYNPNSTIYCDPPYQNVTGFGSSFDHEEFWQWVRTMSKLNKVLVSEYSAPDDFIPIWEKDVKSSLSANGKYGKSKTSTEKLFVHNNLKGNLDVMLR